VTSPHIYIPTLVSELHQYYGDLLRPSKTGLEVSVHLERVALKMYQGILEKNEAILKEINNYHKGYLGMPIATLRDLQLSKQEAFTAIAHEYGFASWEQVEQAHATYDPFFENALSMLLGGEVTPLKNLLQKHPNLVADRSPYGHKATLLHYCGSNGIELWRQQVPDNIVEIAKILLQEGADKNALMKVYGGEFTTHALAESSAHPYDAGVSSELLSVLR